MQKRFTAHRGTWHSGHRPHQPLHPSGREPGSSLLAALTPGKGESQTLQVRTSQTVCLRTHFPDSWIPAWGLPESQSWGALAGKEFKRAAVLAFSLAWGYFTQHRGWNPWVTDSHFSQTLASVKPKLQVRFPHFAGPQRGYLINGLEIGPYWAAVKNNKSFCFQTVRSFRPIILILPDYQFITGLKQPCTSNPTDFIKGCDCVIIEQMDALQLEPEWLPLVRNVVFQHSESIFFKDEQQHLWFISQDQISYPLGSDKVAIYTFRRNLCTKVVHPGVFDNAIFHCHTEVFL